ncbi:MAG: hypothetical protein ACOCRX_05070 [Candidatus Woesearchaeota archaeon]
MKIKPFDKIETSSLKSLRDFNDSCVILDTNAFFVPYNSNFDFLKEIKDKLRCKFVIFDFVYEELESLINKNQSNLKKVKLFNMLLQNYLDDFLFIKTNLSINDSLVDDILVNLIKNDSLNVFDSFNDNNDNNHLYLFTIDNGLKKRLRSNIRIISLRQNKRIFFE